MGGTFADSGSSASHGAQPKALWVSTNARGGVTTYVRFIKETSLWTDWNIRHVVTHRDGSKWSKITAFLIGAWSFVLELARFRPHLVHLHSSADASFIRKTVLLWISRLAGVPVVFHMHGSNIEHFYTTSPPLFQAIIRRTLSAAAAVVALGDTWAARLRAIAPDAHVVQIPNAVRLAHPVRQPLPGEPVRVLFLGRIGEWKGTFRLLEAWALLGNPAATLTLAGDGEVEQARRLVRELGVQDQVEVHDWLSPDAVSELLDRSHILVLPSRNEGQPMAVLEAMARGLCIVASEAGGLAEMIGGDCGVIVLPNDADSIAAGLRLVIDDPELRARCAKAAFERVGERYDVDTVAQQLNTLYRRVTSGTVPADTAVV